MSLSISGLGSGFDINSWVSSLVSAKRSNLVSPLQSKLSTLESTNSSLSNIKSKYTSLQSSLKAFTDIVYNSSSDMWANTSISSSDSDYVTASSSGLVNTSGVEVKVQQIATATVAKGFEGLGSDFDIDNVAFKSLANNQAKTGSFSLFLDGKKYEIQINDEDSLGKVIDDIKNLGKNPDDENSEGVFDVSFANGKLSINSKDAQQELTLGSSSDTSNFASVLKLYKNENNNGYTSEYAISRANTEIALSDKNSGFKDIVFSGENNSGIVKINGVEIEVDEKTTINDLISKINNNSDTHAKASYDSLKNQFILTSTETGASNIALSEENTNLLNKLGLTDGEGENEILRKNSQKLGDNAIVYIGENKIVSNSNTITGESSGITNLSITVKKPTLGEDAPSSVSLNISPDYSKVKSALNSFVSAYNDVVSTTKSAVSSNGAMAHDSSLSSILSSIKNITSMTSSGDGAFSVLSQIGITTSSADPTKLSIDNKKLDEALSKNPESVKKLLSDGYVSKEDTGIFDKLLQNVNSILDSDNGYFATKTDSISSQIKLMNSRIERANTQLSKYETRITEQFNRMDTVLSQLSTQLSTFQAYVR